MPLQKRVTAAAAAVRPSTASPRSSTGSRSTRGSSPTTSCVRFRSTGSATRSAKHTVAVRAPTSTSDLTPLSVASGGDDNSCGLERQNPQLRRRAAQERTDQQQVVRVLGSKRRSGVEDGPEARLDLELSARTGRQRADADDSSGGDEERPVEAGLACRDDQADAQASQALELGQGGDRLLERVDSIAQPGGVLEALITGEPSHPCAQRR